MSHQSLFNELSSHRIEDKSSYGLKTTDKWEKAEEWNKQTIYAIKTMRSGDPKGSVLVPMRFNLVINYLKLGVNTIVSKCPSPNYSG